MPPAAKRKRTSESMDEVEKEYTLSQMAEQIAQLSSRVSALELSEIETECDADEGGDDCAMEEVEDDADEVGAGENGAADAI